MYLRKRDKKLVIVLVIIVLIALAVGIYLFTKPESKPVNTNINNTTTNTVVNNTNNTNTTSQNETTENVIDDVTNTIDPNIGTEAITDNKPTNTTKIPEIIANDELKPDEQKAINIAKNDFGDSTGYYFTYEGKEDVTGHYIVAVRNKADTKALRWYYIDINTGIFETE